MRDISTTMTYAYRQRLTTIVLRIRCYIANSHTGVEKNKRRRTKIHKPFNGQRIHYIRRFNQKNYDTEIGVGIYNANQLCT